MKSRNPPSPSLPIPSPSPSPSPASASSSTTTQTTHRTIIHPILLEESEPSSSSDPTIVHEDLSLQELEQLPVKDINPSPLERNPSPSVHPSNLKSGKSGPKKRVKMGSPDSYSQGSQDDRPVTTDVRTIRVKTSRKLMVGSTVCLISWGLILISFSSPYWLSSYKYTYSSFVRLGLWDFCFNGYRHPPYQYDEKFGGCHWVYSSKFQNIREWLQPGWFIFVQAMMTISMLLSLGSLVCLSVVLMYFMVRYQVVIILFSFILQTAAASTLILAIIVFGAMAFDRSWLLNPTWNHLDWAYYVAIVALFSTVIGAGILLLEARDARERKRKMHNLVYNMQPRMGSANAHAFSDSVKSAHHPHPPLPPPPVMRPSSAQPSGQTAPYFTTV